jgi:hypothetical protein
MEERYLNTVVETNGDGTVLLRAGPHPASSPAA